MKIIILIVACLVVAYFSTQVSAWIEGHERSCGNNPARQTEPFEIPEGSFIHIQKLPAVQGDVVRGPLRRIEASFVPLGVNSHGYSIVVLDNGDHFYARLSPFNHNYDKQNNGTQEYRSLITRPNMSGLVALLQPPDSNRPLDGLSRVYFTGPERRFVVQGVLHHSTTNGFW